MSKITKNQGFLKEFENWNSKQKRIVPSTTGRFHTLVDSERKRAWKAALDWVLKHDYHDMDYEIRKELNELI